MPRPSKEDIDFQKTSLNALPQKQRNIVIICSWFLETTKFW